MTRLFQTAAIALASAILIASPAAADTTARQVSITFTYDETETLDENYRKLRTEVRRACRTGDVIVSSFFARQSRRECRAALLTQAVATSGRQALIALHGEQASPTLAIATNR